LLEFEVKNAAAFGLALHHPPFRQQRRIDRQRLDGANEFSAECRIDAKAAEHHTPARADRRTSAVAAVDRLAGTSGVDNVQPPPAPTADQKAGEESPAAATRLRAIPAAVGVGRQLPLILLELLPVDVAFVVVLQQDLTVLKRAMVAIGLARPAVDDLCSVDAFAVGVDAGIEWVLQHRYDTAVSDWGPIERGHPLAVRGPREMHLRGLQRQMHLAGTAKLAKALEDVAGDLLNTAIRIEAEANLTVPDIADRHGNPQFAPTSLGACGI
jgi:hypothetical protein